MKFDINISDCDQVTVIILQNGNYCTPPTPPMGESNKPTPPTNSGEYGKPFNIIDDMPQPSATSSGGRSYNC